MTWNRSTRMPLEQQAAISIPNIEDVPSFPPTRTRHSFGSSTNDMLSQSAPVQVGRADDHLGQNGTAKSNIIVPHPHDKHQGGSSTPSDSTDLSMASSEGKPANFGVVMSGVYRSGYPTPADFDYLRELQLKTIVSLSQKEELDRALSDFAAQEGINQVVFSMKGTKKEAIHPDTMRAILDIVLEPRNYPLLIHCNHGRHRTGCVVASLRKTAGWGVQQALNEYHAYAEPKPRDCDVEYITNFEGAALRPSSMLVADVIFPRHSRLIPVQIRAFKRALGVAGIIMLLLLVSGRGLFWSQDLKVL